MVTPRGDLGDVCEASTKLFVMFILLCTASEACFKVLLYAHVCMLHTKCDLVRSVVSMPHIFALRL